MIIPLFSSSKLKLKPPRRMLSENASNYRNGLLHLRAEAAFNRSLPHRNLHEKKASFPYHNHHTYASSMNIAGPRWSFL